MTSFFEAWKSSDVRVISRYINDAPTPNRRKIRKTMFIAKAYGMETREIRNRLLGEDTHVINRSN